MRLTSKGQVTVPQPLHDRFQMGPNSEVTVKASTDGILIKPTGRQRLKTFGTALRRARGSSDTALSTAEVLQMTRDTF